MTSTPLMIAFGQRIRTLRHAMGWSQEDLAERTGLDRTYISSVERGQRNISLNNIAALATALEVNFAELFEGLKPDDYS